MVVVVGCDAYLAGLELLLQLGFLVIAGELGVLLVDLCTHFVDVGLKLVLLVLGVGDKLVLHDHAVLLLGEVGNGLHVEGGGARGQGKVTLLDLLLDLAGLGLVVTLKIDVSSGRSFESLAFSFFIGLRLPSRFFVITHLLALNGLLNLHILNVVSRLDVQDTVQVQSGLELADHEVVLLVSLDTLDAESADPGVHLAREHLRLGVLGLKVEGLLAVESENLGRGHNVAAVEDGKRGVLIGDLGALLPGELDGVVADVVDGEVADTENGRENGAGESGTTGDGLVGVEGEGELLAEELLDGGLESRDTGAATNKLDGVNVLNLQLGLSESLLKRSSAASKKRLHDLLELLSLEETADINVVHQRLNVDGGASVGGQNLLQLLAGGNNTELGLGVLVDVNLELLLELCGKVVDDGLVEVAATEVTVVGGRDDLELSLAELDNGGGVVAVTNVDKGDSLRLLVRTGHVGLGDTPAEGGGGGLVDQAQNLEARDLGGINDGSSLSIGVPGRDGDDHVVDGKLELSRSGLLGPCEEHGGQLSGSKLLLLALV